MISRFHVKNYRSIVDLDLSFTFDEGKAPSGFKEMTTWPFLEDKTGRYAPCLAIYGANASGKTNIIRAFNAFQAILEHGIEGKYNPNKLHTSLADTTLELEYAHGENPNKSNTYTYTIVYNATTIIQEKLTRDNQVIYSINNGKPEFSVIATDEYTTDRLKTIYEVECCTAKEESHIVQHTPFLKKISVNYSGLNSTLTDTYRFLNKSLFILPNNDTRAGIGFLITDSIISEDKRPAFYDRLTDLIRKLDVGIDRIEYIRTKQTLTEDSYSFKRDEILCNIHKGEEDKPNMLELQKIYTYHQDVEGNQVKFRFSEESEGTCMLFGVLGMILSILDIGGTLIIDELDRSLHPLILKTLVKLFKDKDYNEKNAQLIFTTHATDLLEDDLLRVSEVAIVNKTIKKGTTICRLSEYKDIRNVTNFRKRYLAGSFRGIPYPYL